METYIIGAVILVVFIVIIIIGVKRTNARQAERMKMLSEGQLETLKASGLTDRGKNLVSTAAVLTNVKEGDGKKAVIDFIFWNAWTQRYEIGDDKMSRELMTSENVKVGDYIVLVIKTKDGIIDKIVDIEAQK